MYEKKKARKIIQFVLHGHDNSNKSNKQNEIKRQKNDVDNEPVKERKTGKKQGQTLTRGHGIKNKNSLLTPLSLQKQKHKNQNQKTEIVITNSTLLQKFQKPHSPQKANKPYRS